MYQPKTISGKDMVPDGAYPVFGANGIIGRYDQYNHAEPQLLITCRGATCGSVNVSQPNSWITGNAMVVRPKDDSIDLRYLEYYFRGGIDISSAITGAAQPQITRTNLEPLTIHYPTSLDEQRRIVAVLDKAFARIATATANAQANRINARALFESHLAAQLRECSSIGAKTNIGSEVDFSFGFAFKSSGYTADPGGIPLLRGDNIVNGALRWDGVVRWPIGNADAYQSFALQSGDVVLAMDRTWVKSGLKFAVVHKEDLPLLQVQRVARMRCRLSVLNRFLSYQIESPAFTNYIIGIQTGLGVPHISGKQIAAYEFSMPSLPEQKKLVDQLDSLKADVTALETAYRSKLAALTELKQSLLQKAFAGELT